MMCGRPVWGKKNALMCPNITYVVCMRALVCGSLRDAAGAVKPRWSSSLDRLDRIALATRDHFEQPVDIGMAPWALAGVLGMFRE